MTDKSTWVTAPKAAKLLNVSRQWVTSLCRAGKLKAQRLEGMSDDGVGRWIIQRESVDKFRLERQRRLEKKAKNK